MNKNVTDAECWLRTRKATSHRTSIVCTYTHFPIYASRSLLRLKGVGVGVQCASQYIPARVHTVALVARVHEVVLIDHVVLIDGPRLLLLVMMLLHLLRIVLRRHRTAQGGLRLRSRRVVPSGGSRVHTAVRSTGRRHRQLSTKPLVLRCRALTLPLGARVTRALRALLSAEAPLQRLELAQVVWVDAHELLHILLVLRQRRDELFVVIDLVLQVVGVADAQV